MSNLGAVNTARGLRESLAPHQTRGSGERASSGKCTRIRVFRGLALRPAATRRRDPCTTS